MIDNFSILLSHVLIALAFYHLLSRDDLDTEAPPLPDIDPNGFDKKPDASIKKSIEPKTMRDDMRDRPRA